MAGWLQLNNMKAFVIIGLLLGLFTSAHAQSLSLPKIDSVNFYGEIGDFESKEAKNLQPVGTLGWGFESVFIVAANTSHICELAVGYGQVIENMAFHNGYTLTGEVQDLPSISLYFTFHNDIYIGIGTGLISLANASINEGSTRITVSGDTFDASAKVGYAIPLQRSLPLEEQRFFGFVEADYDARYFGGLTYTGTPPLSPGALAELPTRIYLGGASLAIGVQVLLDPINSKSPVGTKFIRQ